MRNILLVIKVPVLMESYEIFVPGNLKVYELIELLSSAISKISLGRYQSSGNEKLCAENGNIILANEKILDMCNLGNGDSVYFI